MKTKLIIFVDTDGDKCGQKCKHLEDGGCNLFESLLTIDDKGNVLRNIDCKVAQTAPWT